MSRYKDALGNAVYGDKFSKHHALEPMCWDAARLIERLRAEILVTRDVAHEQEDRADKAEERIKSLGTDLDRKIVTITRQRQRIEELEEGEAFLRRCAKAAVFISEEGELKNYICEKCGLADWVEGHIITRKQIDEAWSMISGWLDSKQGAIEVLAKLGIVRDGDGWKIGGDDD